MRFKSLVSPLALIIGLGVVGGAVAQDTDEKWWTVENGAMMISGAPITPEQADYVQNYCDDLQMAFEEESVAGGGSISDDSEDDDMASDSDEEPSLEDLPTSMIDFDLSQLTREDCIEAGFITE